MSAALALLLSTLAVAGIGGSPAAAASAPYADGYTIRMHVDGYWQVQDRQDGFKSICEGKIRSCRVSKASSYKVTNHWTDQKWNIEVSGGGSGGSSGSGGTSSGTGSPDFTKLKPRLHQPRYNGTYVSVSWTRPSGTKGVNVYRNGAFQASINGGTVYNDYRGRAGDTYYVTAYSHSNKHSLKSDRLVATRGGELTEVRSLTAKDRGSGKTELSWRATSTAVGQWRIYRDGKHWKTVGVHSNPSHTYKYYDGTSLSDEISVYEVKPVSEPVNGSRIVGKGTFTLSPQLRVVARDHKPTTWPAPGPEHQASADNANRAEKDAYHEREKYDAAVDKAWETLDLKFENLNPLKALRLGNAAWAQAKKMNHAEKVLERALEEYFDCLNNCSSGGGGGGGGAPDPKPTGPPIDPETGENCRRLAC